MQKDKTKEPKIKTESRTFKTEIIMFFIFTLVGVGLILLKADGWLSLIVLILGLLSLYLNDISNWLDLFLGLLWSGAYCYFSISNGLLAQAILVSAFYLFINIYNIFTKTKNINIVEENKRLKGYQIVALCVTSICVAVGTYFLISLWAEQRLAIFDTLCAVLLCVSLYMMLKRSVEYFLVRLIAMIAIVALWVTVALLYNFGVGCMNIAVMFIAFILYDNIRIRKWSLSVKKAKQDSIFNSSEYKEAESRYRRANRKGLPQKSIGVDKDDERR